MADVNKTIQISYEARTQDLEKALKRIPGVTEQEAKKMAVAMEGQLKKTERAAQKSSKAIGKSFKKAGKAIGAIAGSAALAGAGILAFAQQIADLSNQLSDASTKTGLTVETLGGLRLAAEGAGVGFTSLEPGLIKLQSSIVDAAAGTGAAAEAFDLLKIKAKDSSGNLKSSDAIFKEIAGSLSGLEDQTVKNTVAMDIFGMRAGPGLLQSGALDNLEAFTNLAAEFGVNMTEGAADAADFQRAMAEIKTTTQGALAELLNVVIGTDELSAAIFKVSDGVVFFGALFEDAFSTSKSVIGALFGPFSVLNSYLTQSVHLLQAILTGDLLGIKTAFVNFSESITDFNTDILDAYDGVENFGLSIDKANERVEELHAARALILEQNDKEDSDTKKRLKKLEEEIKKGEEKTEQLKAEKAVKDELLKADKARFDALKELAALTKSSQNALISSDELEIQSLEEKRERINELFELSEDQAAAQLAMNALQMEADKTAHDIRLTQIEKEKNARLEFLDILTSSAGQTADAIQETLENTGQITKQQAERLHILSKTAAVSDIAINTAVAISKAFAQLGPLGGPIAAGLIGASGAAQTAAVLSSPPPTFDMGGMIGNGDALRPGQSFIRAQKGEAILDESTVRNIGGEDGVNALQRTGGIGPQIIIMNPFKHLDRYNKSALQQNSALNSAIRGARSFGSGAY